MRHVGVDRNLADRLFDGLAEVNSGGLVTYWNPAAERITGYAAGLVLGRHFQSQPARHISEAGVDLPDSTIPVLMTLKDGQPREGLAFLNHADGYRFAIVTRTGTIPDERRRVAGAYELFSDNRSLIAAHRSAIRTEETIFFDPLTGIGNRPHIETKIRAALEDFRERGRRFGLLFVDIDHFKDFNDVYGHLVGDKILRMAANTLRQSLRGSDSCGRWGGDEFIVLVHELDPKGLQKVAGKLLEAAAQARLSEHDTELGITVSIGASLAAPTDTVRSLIERCDRLMYESKQQGRNRVTVDN